MFVAICDDDKKCHASELQLLQEYMAENHLKIHIKQFYDGESLITACENGTYFDLIFLDVLMGGMNGISTAAALRKQGIKSAIVFLTSSRDFAIESYGVGALFYLLKPVDITQFNLVMNRFFKEYRPVKVQIGNLVFSISDIIFAESLNKKVAFHYKDGTVKTITAQLEEVAGTLCFPNFLRCHKSYLVNLDHVRRIEQNSFLTVNGDMVLIRQKEFTAIKKQYYEYLTSI